MKFIIIFLESLERILVTIMNIYQTSLKMKKLFLSCMLIVSAFFAFGQVTYNLYKKDSAIVEEIKRRYDYERELIMRQDFVALEKFYPADFVVTNPFSQFINKEKVMERYRANIIKVL
jgi:hypothetical protein